ncbi:MAG: roadblock/LC7 domain-containing protein [Planctomycetota bacterium]
MREVLAKLNEMPGIKGSLIVTPDGIVVASRMDEHLNEETTAAHLGNVVTQTRRLLEAGRFPPLAEMVLSATRGRIVIVNLEIFLLVAVTNQYIDLDITILEIKSAAKRLRELATMKV